MIEFLPGAEAELQAAADWYEHEEQGLGLRFLAAVQEAAENLEAHPQIGAIWQGGSEVQLVAQFRRIPIRRFPFVMVYSEADGVIIVVALAHGSRQPGYWLSRTRK